MWAALARIPGNRRMLCLPAVLPPRPGYSAFPAPTRWCSARRRICTACIYYWPPLAAHARSFSYPPLIHPPVISSACSNCPRCPGSGLDPPPPCRACSISHYPRNGLTPDRQTCPRNIPMGGISPGLSLARAAADAIVLSPYAVSSCLQQPQPRRSTWVWKPGSAGCAACPCITLVAAWGCCAR